MTTIEGLPKPLKLKDQINAQARTMTPDDAPALLQFYRDLPEEDRLFLREDVTKEKFMEQFIRGHSDGKAFSIIAESDGKIVGNATLYRSAHGWTRHVGEIRVVIARQLQHKGLGTALAKVLVRHAINIGLDKMVAEVIDNQAGAKRAFEKLGFHQEAVLRKHVKDINGVSRDLVIMANDVTHLWQTMEAMVSDFRYNY